MQKTRVQSLGWEDPLEKEMANHSSTLAWKISWTEEPGRLQSMGSQESDMTEHKAHTTMINKLKNFPLLLVFKKVTGSIIILLVEGIYEII